MPRRLTIEDAKHECNERGFEWLSPEYINALTKAPVRCGAGHEWSVRLNDIKNGRGCPHCSGKAHLTIEDARTTVEERGFELLSTEYINNKSKLLVRCGDGHMWHVCLSAIKRGSGCPHCAGKIITLEDAKREYSERGFKLLATKYVNNYTKMPVRCDDGHLWSVHLNNIKNGHGCPQCADGRSERACRATVESVFSAKFPKIKPEWLLSPRGGRMELDGYNEELAVAFEYQGQQHYVFVEHFHRTREHYEYRRSCDARKRELCRENGVLLIEVPYTVAPAEFGEFVRAEYARLLKVST